MSTFRCLILCVSVHHGNTAKVARALAGPLSAEVLAPDEVPDTACNHGRLWDSARASFTAGCT